MRAVGYCPAYCTNPRNRGKWYLYFPWEPELPFFFAEFSCSALSDSFFFFSFVPSKCASPWRKKCVREKKRRWFYSKSARDREQEALVFPFFIIIFPTWCMDAYGLARVFRSLWALIFLPFSNSWQILPFFKLVGVLFRSLGSRALEKQATMGAINLLCTCEAQNSPQPSVADASLCLPPTSINITFAAVTCTIHYVLQLLLYQLLPF